MRDDRDRRFTTDTSGNTWLTDRDGNVVHDESGDPIPGPAERIPDPISQFTTYDTSRGHCGLCGRLTCSGTCFK